MTSVALRTPENPVHPRAKIWWAASRFVGYGALTAIAGLVALLWADSRPVTLPLTGFFLVLTIVFSTVEPFWRHRIHRWEIGNDAVYSVSGWWVIEWRIAPYSRVQTVDVKRGPLERMLGLSKVIVTTASSSGPISIVGLEAARADEVALELKTLTENVEGDGT